MLKVQPAGAYEVLASFYDQLMSHVDYPMWADFVRGVWDLHARVPLDSAYDAACGTGRFLDALHEKGLRLAGSDLSENMLEAARRRLGRRAQLSRRDLRELTDPARWRLVTCLYDSLNYLTGPGELVRALGRLAALSAPGGLVVFDICTERNSLAYFNDRTEREQNGEWVWERHSWYERTARLHHNDFLLDHLPSRRRWAESHLQRIYRVTEVEEAARQAGLHVLARYAEFSLRPGGEDADRVHFVTRPLGTPC
ncbi:MAG: methyltransferase domain-containing protein [Candidatus Delongbacteria bacterium]